MVEALIVSSRACSSLVSWISLWSLRLARSVGREGLSLLPDRKIDSVRMRLRDL